MSYIINSLKEIISVFVPFVFGCLIKNDFSFYFFIMKMNSECVICFNDVININNNCNICNNGICNSCYIHMVHRKKQTLSHKCPFCKNENFKEWIDIDKKVIVDFFIRNENLMIKEILKLQDIIDSKDIEIRRKDKELELNKELSGEQQNIINSLLLSLPKPNDVKKKMKYQQFYKITYWGLRDIDISPQEAIKRVSILWKEYKQSFE